MEKHVAVHSAGKPKTFSPNHSEIRCLQEKESAFVATSPISLKPGAIRLLLLVQVENTGMQLDLFAHVLETYSLAAGHAVLACGGAVQSGRPTKQESGTARAAITQ